jgi:hypothetical protein
MAITSTLNFLPETFKSVTNQRFLGATMDQLLTDAVNIPVSGYIGRTFAPTYKLGDNYVPEFNSQRTNYQLEPSVVVKDSNNNVVLNSGYIDLLQGIANNGGLANNHQRLFTSEYYNFDGHFDYDKFVNYNNYYWMPNGPDSVNVTSSATPLMADYTVTRNTAAGGFTFSTYGGHPNTQLTLARGGTYKFIVDQPGFNFWIQSKDGVNGIDPNVATITTREVYGVSNNGTDSGVIQFNVPQSNAQDFFISMPTNATVSAAVTFNYSDIQNVLLSTFLKNFPEGLDGINNQLQNKTFIFINNAIDDSFWTANGGLMPGIVPTADRHGVWQINLVPTGSDFTIQIRPTVGVTSLQKIFIGSGKTYASAQFWLNNNNIYQRVPLITAPADYLFYQDSSNPNFVGQIKLVDNVSTPIDINNDIIGKTNYTSPNGVIFTNGLKVQFDSLVVPSLYAGNEYYVDGVGTSIALAPVDQLVVPESFGSIINTTADYITINRSSQDSNAWSRSNRWFHKDVLNVTAAYNKTSVNYGPNIPGRRAIIEFEPNLQLFNFGRQNKNNVDLIVGVNSNDPVTDAFVQIEGQSTYTLDGVLLTTGMRIIFAKDYDTKVRNEIWQVDIEVINSQYYIRLIKTNDDPVTANQCVLITQGSHVGKTYWFDGVAWHDSQEKTAFNQAPLFDLVDSNGYSFGDTTVYPDSTFTGTTFFSYPTVATGINDSVLGFPLQYQNFNNIGDIVFENSYDTDSFEYMSGVNTTSTVLCNTGYLVKNAGLTETIKLNNWIVGKEPTEQYQLITKFFDGRSLSITQDTSAIYPIGSITPAGAYAAIQLDSLPIDSETIPHLKIYTNNQLLEPGIDYNLIPYGVYNVIVLMTTPKVGDKIDIAVFSNEVSAIGFYQVPQNLDLNPLNQGFPAVGSAGSGITLGQIRTHYNKLIENTTFSRSTTIPLQDNYLKQQGGTLLQHSSPLIYGMTFITDPVVNIVNGITLARNEYQRFKNKFLHLCQTLKGLDYNDPITGVDIIMSSINLVKNSSFPWYYSDMVPQGSNFNTINYTVVNARQTNYEIDSIFDTTTLSNRAVLVYHNGVQLIGDGIDYEFNPVSPEVIINVPLKFGDTIMIRDYLNTDGNYVPETPVKLGLSQDYTPALYTDTTYLSPVAVIRGHDGSITPAFGDFRDEFLIELEKRIYNNNKSTVERGILNRYDIIPGRFRTTDYSLPEWTQLITQNFLQWVGSNNIDYTANDAYDENNPWTWNYDQWTDSVDGSFLQGSWRAIYNYWFDTDIPHIAPWEMLGITEIPSWWATRYGPAPYTSGNTTLWADLEAGYIWNGGNTLAYNDMRFARPGLTSFIPVDSAGNLLDPTAIGIVGKENPTSASNSFQVGEFGPVETAWRRSSDYPFAVQHALALARPAQYFATMVDLSRFYKNPVTGQFSNLANQKIAPTLLTVNGDTVSEPGTVLRTCGYLNWIADYIKNLGMDPVAKIESYFSNFSVQLAYKVAGFTDQNLISITAEQTSPGSTNSSIIIPTENYVVYLGQPVPVKTISYSGVVVTKTDKGYSVTGYNTAQPFFNILPSIANNNSQTITVNNLTAKVYQTGSKIPLTIPYGTTLTSPQQVADFLISYQRYLSSQGFLFTTFDVELQTTRDWILSIREFLTWAQQGWATGTLLVLNPIVDVLEVNTVGAVIDEITNIPNGSRLLNTNFAPIKSTNFNVLRTDSPTAPLYNQFQVSTLDTTGIAFAELNLIQYETTLIFDNIDDFGDIIYIPEQGTRQFRLKLTGVKTGGWDGALSAAGYIYSNPQISAWQPGTDYKQGDLVTYNNANYTAPRNIVANQDFALSNWTQISSADIQTGLLPSFGHNAQVFENIYDVDNPPQDKNFQLFSAGLIGFRERPFLSNLGISVPTQTKFYQGYIKQKGTIDAITALTSATFETIAGNINVFEEWAFQVGQYGSVNSNQYTEFVLDQSVFLTNPVALTVTNNYNTGNIIVNLAVTGNTTTSNVYNASNIYSTSTSLYNDRANVAYSSDLPTSGYVNLADVDYQIFDISTITTLPGIVDGNKIWVAKDFGSGWNVYRTNATPLTTANLNYSLGSTAQLVFGTTHSLTQNEFFVVQGFSSVYDGLYQVNSVPDNTSVTVTIQNTANIIASGGSISSTGNIFTLQSMVVSTDASIGSNPPPNGWLTNDRQWVNTDTNAGATGWAIYTYDAGSSTWVRTRQQAPTVDISSIGRTFIYNKSNNVILSSIDYIDHAKGKLLNAIGVDIDYQLTSDPALYNAGTGTIHPDYHWGPDQVGKIWWNIDAVRYINYEQDQLIYRLNHWGTTFPGSQIAVYEWVHSPVPPSKYVAKVGDGVPLATDDSAFSATGFVDDTGAVQVGYYFWVAGKTSVNKVAGKSNSVHNITAAIINPQAQGIPYATILRNDTVALYNVNTALTGKNSVLHLGTRNIQAGVVHSEYQLVQEGNPHSQIPAVIKSKIIDSIVGQDSAGNAVPDPALTPAQAYGISVRPRQSMFINQSLALSNYLTFVNKILSTYPVVERKLMTGLNSEQAVPNPNLGYYNRVVNSYAELAYVDADPLTVGYTILVNSDINNLGKWAIYELTSKITTNSVTIGTWTVVTVQSFKTNLYWSFQDWYQTDYNYTVTPDVTVANLLEYGKLNLKANTYVKVLNAGNNQFVVYYVDENLQSSLVGIQNGTIQISTGTIPALELREILTAIQNDIFINDLSNDYNQLFFTMVKYALSEQKNLDWVFKTSFLSATQYLRQLEQVPAYVADNQQYYLDYINEVKPYRTTIREFVVDYQGNDQFSGDTTDFDLPPYWDAGLGIYRSPNGEQVTDANLLSATNSVYSQWYQNYTYNVVNAIIETPGKGFLFEPQITITGGGATINATAYATLNGNGGIGSIIITDPGKGYTSTPDIIINGTGTGATAYPIMRNVFDNNNSGHNLVRSISTTVKFDRVNYAAANTFVFWSNITSANIGQTLSANTIIVNNDILYVLANAYTIDANVDFPVANVSTITAGTFNNANDRIVAYNGYINLATTQLGLEYPGVIVDGNTFTGNVYDSVIQSFYGNTLGVNPYDINIDGGSYISTFASHAPEELVPGRMFDSLNLTVYATSGIDFRLFNNMSGNVQFLRIANANVTTLSSNLHLTDSTISVVNASLLPLPSISQNIPGVVFVNGEKITYWRNYALETQTPWTANAIIDTNTLISYNGNAYITNGNVYSSYFANIASNVQQVSLNTLAQIRRGVDATYSPAMHPATSRVIDASVQQLIPNSAITTTQTYGNIVYPTSASTAVSYGLTLNLPTSANCGDIITQKDMTTNLVTSTMRVLETVENSTVIPVIILSGAVNGLPVFYDNGTGFDEELFDNTSDAAFINGIQTTSYIKGIYMLGNPSNIAAPGLITTSGTITVQANTAISVGNCWYTPGFGTATNGFGFDLSTTAQATFLKARMGFVANPGTTP